MSKCCRQVKFIEWRKKAIILKQYKKKEISYIWAEKHKKDILFNQLDECVTFKMTYKCWPECSQGGKTSADL